MQENWINILHDFVYEALRESHNKARVVDRYEAIVNFKEIIASFFKLEMSFIMEKFPFQGLCITKQGNLELCITGELRPPIISFIDSWKKVVNTYEVIIDTNPANAACHKGHISS